MMLGKSWDGRTWRALGSGMAGDVYALAVGAGDVLYAGGWFTNAGGVAVNKIAKWNGATWSALGAGVGGNMPDRVGIRALYWDHQSGSLLAGGSFTTAGGVSAPGVARWNGVAWAPVGAGLDGSPNAFAVDEEGRIIAVGGPL
jgi:hypothetical protein